MDTNTISSVFGKAWLLGVIVEFSWEIPCLPDVNATMDMDSIFLQVPTCHEVNASAVFREISAPGSTRNLYLLPDLPWKCTMANFITGLRSRRNLKRCHLLAYDTSSKALWICRWKSWDFRSSPVPAPSCEETGGILLRSLHANAVWKDLRASPLLFWDGKNKRSLENWKSGYPAYRFRVMKTSNSAISCKGLNFKNEKENTEAKNKTLTNARQDSCCVSHWNAKGDNKKRWAVKNHRYSPTPRDNLALSPLKIQEPPKNIRTFGGFISASSGDLLSQFLPRDWIEENNRFLAIKMNNLIIFILI